MMAHISNFAPVADVAADVAQFLDSLDSLMLTMCFAENRYNNFKLLWISFEDIASCCCYLHGKKSEEATMCKKK